MYTTFRVLCSPLILNSRVVVIANPVSAVVTATGHCCCCYPRADARKDVSKLFLSLSPCHSSRAEDNYDPTLAVDAIAHARLCMHNARSCATTPRKTLGAQLRGPAARYNPPVSSLSFLFCFFFFSARLK